MTIATRPATEGDRPFLVRCFLDAVRESVTASRGRWDEARERTQFEAALDLDRTTIIETDAVEAGFVMIVELPGILMIHTIAIAPAFQHRGIGSDIVRDLVNIGRQTSRDVVLSVLKTNPRAERLYARLGFVVVEESPTHRHMRFAPETPSR